MFALKSFLASVKSSDLCCPAGQSNWEHPGLGALGCRSLKGGNNEIWAAPSAEIPVALQGLSSCLACLPCLLFPAAGQMLQMLYPGHYSAAALPRKLSRLGLYCTGSCRGTAKESSPPRMMKNKQLYCVFKVRFPLLSSHF